MKKSRIGFQSSYIKKGGDGDVSTRVRDNVESSYIKARNFFKTGHDASPKIHPLLGTIVRGSFESRYTKKRIIFQKG